MLRRKFETVFLARHGETMWNVDRRSQGRLDSPLTKRGRLQAQALRSTVESLVVDAVFASPLGRAAVTAKICAERLELPVVTIEELAEVHPGERAGLTSEEFDQRFPGELDRRAADKYRYRYPGGESYADARERAGTALRRIEEAGVRSPLVVSHEMIGRMLVCQLMDMDPNVAIGWVQPHCLIYGVDVLNRRLRRHCTDMRHDHEAD